MLERTSRFHFDDILAGSLVFEQDNGFSSVESKRGVRKRLCTVNATSKPNEVSQLSDDHIMTRKTRTRTPRIPTIQSGYCAVCNVPYNSVEDHIQSKKHQKLIGEDANYIALNGSLNGFLNTNSIPFLNLNGIDAIGVHETSLDEFSPPLKRRNMRRSRAPSVACDRPAKKAAPLSPTISEKAGHCLRSRRNINYMTPPLDDDSLLDPPDICVPDEPPELQLPPPAPQTECQEYRELRSSTRALAKLMEPVPEPQEEVWNSGRPKRACIKQKRISLDETLSTNCKTFYKVEVVTSKSRSKRDPDSSRRQSQSPKRDGEEKNKGLIVKFKKLRNSELITLNNEATNFLFPKKEEESSEDDVTDGEVNNSTVGSIERSNSALSMYSDTETSNKKSRRDLDEDDASMDSNCSRTKKRRRTHAEAFIRDNQKYYKFETPGSRLRYHGSYLTPVLKSPKHNGHNSLDKIKIEIKQEAPESTNTATFYKSTFSSSKYKFSFEKVPATSYKYLPFFRQDHGQQDYVYFTDDAYWGDAFILPYQVPRLKPLDRKRCINRCKEVLKILREPVPESENNSSCGTPDPNYATSPSMFVPEHDDDSKMSVFTLTSTCSTEDDESTGKKRLKRSKSEMLQQVTGKNPRKSPRQHASTLAILSSFLQQRKRRSKNKQSEDSSSQSLPTIVEEENAQQQTVGEEEQKATQELPQSVSQESPQEALQEPLQTAPTVQKPKRGRKPMTLKPKKVLPKVDYSAIARQIDDELDTVLDGNIEEFDLDIDENETVDFHKTKTSVMDILQLYEESKSKDSVKSYRRFFSGCPPGRKPGRKKKKNKTGWPNKSRRLAKRGPNKEKEENDGSNVDSTSVHNDSGEEICDEDGNILTDSIKREEPKSDSCIKKENCNVDRVDKEKNDKVLTNKVTNSEFQLQPYVFVPKLDSKVMVSKNNIRRPKRTQRCMPVSPRSPRVLRKPRGRWYKER